jgi:hypothetical protein
MVHQLHTRGKRSAVLAALAAAALTVSAAPGASADASTPITQIATPDSPYHSTLAPDHRHLYVTGDAEITVIDVTTRQVTSHIRYPAGITGNVGTSLAFTKFGKAFFTYSTPTGTYGVAVLNAATGTITPIPATGWVVGVTAEGSKLYTIDGAGKSATLTAYSTTTYALLANVALPVGGNGLAWGPPSGVIANGNVYISLPVLDPSDPGGLIGNVAVVSTDTDTVTGSIPELAAGLVASPDGKTLYGTISYSSATHTYGGTVDVISTATLSVTGHMTLPDVWGGTMAVTPDNAYLEVLDAGNIEAFSTKTLQIVDTTPIPPYEFEGVSIAFGADRVWLADFDYNQVDVLPELARVDRVTPASAPAAGGTTVTVYGGRFAGATAVTFGGVPATSFTVVNGGTIAAVAPAGVAGTVQVTVTTPAGTSAGAAFTYTP